MIRPFLLGFLTCFTVGSSQALLREFFEELDALSSFNQQNRAAVYEGVSAAVRASLKNSSKKEEGGSGEGGARTPFDHKMQVSGFNPVVQDPTPKTFDDLPGMSEDVREIVDFFKNAEHFSRVGARIPRGVLLYGPPGTGKTSVARVLAHECGAEFFTAKGSEFIEIYVGVGPKRVRELFEKARACKKAIIFIDEIDSIGGRRSLNVNSEVLSTLNELLSQMDGYAQVTNVLVVAATNRIDILDPALLRPGRFDRVVYVGLPSKETRLSILKYYCSFIPFAGSEEMLAKLALESEGLSGAQLKNVVNEAAVRAGRRKALQVEGDDLVQAFKALKGSGG